MPIQSDHTQLSLGVQAAALLGDAWSSDVVPRLPADLDAQALSLKAFVRRRGLACASDLLRALLAYVLDELSFRALGAWAVLLGLADISDTAWRKRLARASPWLAWLLSQLLTASLACAPDLLTRQRRVLLVDATRLRQIGGTGDDWRVHLAYDLLAGHMAQVHVSDRHTAERLSHFELQPGDIVVADSAYGYRKHLAYAQSKQADVLLRVWLPAFPLEHADGSPFDALGWLSKQHGSLAEWQGYCRYQRRRYRVRLLASKLPSDKLAAARKRKKRKAQKAQRRLSAQALHLAGWLLVVTTLKSSWNALELLELYRARWQIELLFKRLKQLLRLAKLRCQGREALEASVRALLVAWALQEQQVGEMRALLASRARDPHAPASSWLLAGLSVQTLREEVRGSWTFSRVVACLPQLMRFVLSSPRKRCQQEAQVREWLSKRLRLDEPLLAAA